MFAIRQADFEGRRIYCDLFFLDMAGIGFSWKVIPDLPSWAPNFMGVAKAGRGGNPPTLLSRKLGSRSAGPFVFRIDDTPKILQSLLFCKAVFFHEVLLVGPPIIPKSGRRSCPTFLTHNAAAGSYGF
jgi:hypothetical protein